MSDDPFDVLLDGLRERADEADSVGMQTELDCAVELLVGDPFYALGTPEIRRWIELVANRHNVPVVGV